MNLIAGLNIEFPFFSVAVTRFTEAQSGSVIKGRNGCRF